MNTTAKSAGNIRPEMRYQWSPEGQKGNNPLGIPLNIPIFGVDCIYQF